MDSRQRSLTFSTSAFSASKAHDEKQEAATFRRATGFSACFRWSPSRCLMLSMSSLRAMPRAANKAHRHGQPAGSDLHVEKVEVPVDGSGTFVLGIGHDRHRGNLVGVGEAAVQGIQQQMLTQTPALGGLIDGQPGQQGERQRDSGRLTATKGAASRFSAS